MSETSIVLLCVLVPFIFTISYAATFYIVKTKINKLISEQATFNRKQAEVMFKTYNNGKKPTPAQIDSIMKAYTKNK
ncbi:MAG: hypothetical protein LBB39_00150 [Mycoplasmataceae bacterium]|jgi:uncharacterized protein YneF (UPF0154 family)|nr:hypothetical protein [Mycoplasmataceae bacterium]